MKRHEYDDWCDRLADRERTPGVGPSRSVLEDIEHRSGIDVGEVLLVLALIAAATIGGAF